MTRHEDDSDGQALFAIVLCSLVSGAVAFGLGWLIFG